MNSVKEISKMIENKDLVRNDFLEAYTAVNNEIKDRYFSKFSDAIAEHYENVKCNPCREVQLLRSCKLFTPPERHAQIDNLIDCFMKYDTLKHIEEELSETYGHRGSNPNINPFTVYMLGNMMSR